MDPASGKPFFFNRSTGKRRWKAPKQKLHPAVAGPGPAVAEGPATSAAQPGAASAVYMPPVAATVDGYQSPDATAGKATHSSAREEAPAGLASNGSGGAAGSKASDLHLRRDHASVSRNLYGVGGSFSAYMPDMEALNGLSETGDEGGNPPTGTRDAGSSTGADGGGDDGHSDILRGVVVMVDDCNAVDLVRDTDPGTSVPLVAFTDEWESVGRQGVPPPVVSVGNPSSPAPVGASARTQPPPSPTERIGAGSGSGAGSGAGAAAAAGAGSPRLGTNPATPESPVTALNDAGTTTTTSLLSVDGQWEMVTTSAFPRPFFRHTNGMTTWVQPDGVEFVKCSAMWKSMHPIASKTPAHALAARKFLSRAFGEWPPRSLAPVLTKATRAGIEANARKASADAGVASPHASSVGSPSRLSVSSMLPRASLSPRKSTAVGVAPARRDMSVSPIRGTSGAPPAASAVTELPPHVAMRVASELEHRTAELQDLQSNKHLYKVVMQEQGQLARVKGTSSAVFPDRRSSAAAPSSATAAATSKPEFSVAPGAASLTNDVLSAAPVSGSSARRRRASLAAYLISRPVFHVDGDGDDND